MRRCQLGVASVLLLVVAGALLVHAQPPARVARIGWLNAGWRDSGEAQAGLAAFRQGLRDHGRVEGRNVVIEERWAEGNVERLPALAIELARLNVDVIVATATPGARAARHATRTIPIVAVAMGDPVADGLVSSLARPGGNLTGTTFLGPQLLAKHLELLKETSPRISRVAILWHPGAFAEGTTAGMWKEADAAAGTLRIRLHRVEVTTADGLDRAFAMLSRQSVDALVVGPSTMLFNLRRRIVALADEHRLPSIFNSREAVEVGALMGYGANLPGLIRRTATYVDKILAGASPADLPVEQPTTFELAINRKTARALGLVIPPSVLLRADHLIE